MVEVGQWVRVIAPRDDHRNRVGKVISVRNGIVRVQFSDGEYSYTHEDLEVAE